MKKTTYFIFGIIILLFSCKQKENKTELKNESGNEKIIVEKKSAESQKNQNENELFLERLEIVNKWESEIINLDKSGYTLTLEPKKNNYSQNVIDTIKTFTSDKIEFIFYKSEKFEKLISAKIENEGFKIYNLSIGMKYYILEKVLASGIKEKTIKVGNLEQTKLFTLKLDNDILKSIEYEGYVD